MVLTRAFACATPVVASDIDGYREVMTKEAAVSFPAGDEHALARRARRAARGRASPRALSAKARVALALERYSWDDIARRLARDLRGGRGLSLARNPLGARLWSSCSRPPASSRSLWWRGPAWSGIADAFRAVEWRWVAAAVGLNLLSVLARALAWRTVIVQAVASAAPCRSRSSSQPSRSGCLRTLSFRDGSASWRAWQCSTASMPLGRECGRACSAPSSPTASSTWSR